MKFISTALWIPTLLAVGTLARAQQAPGSLLVFPEFDSRVGEQTLLTLTNASQQLQVDVEFIYIDGDQCLEVNRTRRLTPGDTVSVLTTLDNPFSGRGYVYAFAKSSTTAQAISFNHLVGSAVRMTGLKSFDYGFNALSFRGVPAEGAATDIDVDGLRDLNGIEYEEAPERLIFPRFLGANQRFSSDLVLLQLTGTRFQAVVSLLIRNDNEELFSAQHQFGCWTKVRLEDITGIFTEAFLNVTNHDPNEIFGFTGAQQGWFEVDGAFAVSPVTQLPDPAVLGLLVERYRGTTGFLFGFTKSVGESASLPFHDGRQSNGDLLSRSVLGDSN